MKLHKKKVRGGFPTKLPEGSEIVKIKEKPGGAPVYVYYTVPP